MFSEAKSAARRAQKNILKCQQRIFLICNPTVYEGRYIRLVSDYPLGWDVFNAKTGSIFL